MALFSLSPLRSLLVAAGLALGLSACVTDGDVSNPVQRKLSFFSHVNGDDIRAACRPGADDRLRLTFNGRYNDQVRIYDLNRQGGRPVWQEKVIGTLVVNQGLSLSSLGDYLSGQDYSRPLGDDQAQALWQAVADAGAMTPATAGQRLDSDSLWWVAVGCHQGHVFFHAWDHSETSGAPSFFELVQALEMSDRAWPSLKAPPVIGFNSPKDRSERTHFILETGQNGLIL